MKKTILIFGGCSIMIFLVFQLSRYSLTLKSNHSHFLLMLAALTFILMGFYINQLLSSNPGNYKLKVYKKSKLSKQEQKILHLMNEGLSNGEIAENLFIAESTVKKHVSNILHKLSAKRRTEAIKIGRELDII